MRRVSPLPRVDKGINIYLHKLTVLGIAPSARYYHRFHYHRHRHAQRHRQRYRPFAESIRTNDNAHSLTKEALTHAKATDFSPD